MGSSNTPAQAAVEEAYREAMDAWNALDVERFIRGCDPEIEFTSLFAGVEGKVYRGHEGIRRYFADLSETFSEARNHIEAIEHVGDVMVCTLRARGVGKASGAPVEWPAAQVVRYRDGRSYSVKTYSDRASALADAGASGRDAR